MVQRRKGKKTKTKKKNSQAARLRYATPTGLPGSIGDISSKAIHSQVLALSNPWSKAARGAKVPDSDSSKSVACTLSWPTTVGTDANGKAAFYLRPNINAYYKNATAITGQTCTTFAAGVAIPDYAAVSAGFDSYRIVSWGVRVYSTLAPTNQAGSYKIITLPEDPANGFSWAGSLFEETASFSLATQDIHWISRPIGIKHREYVGMTSDAPWDRMFVAVEGAAASVGAVTFEVVLNLEAQINIGSIVSTMATEAAPENHHVTRAAAKTLAKHGGVHTSPSFGRIIGDTAKMALIEGASAAIPMIGPFLRGAFGGGRRGPHQIMDVD